MTDTDKLAKVIFAHPATDGAASTAPEIAALCEDLAAAVLAHLTAEGWAKTEPIWSEGLENDGVHEFSDAYDCDGTFIRRWKRTPERRAKYSAWEADHA